MPQPYPYNVSERVLLYHTLLHHGLSNLHEAGHIGTLHVVDVAVGLSTILHSRSVDGLHDVVQLGINLFARPAESDGVLSHFET